MAYDSRQLSIAAGGSSVVALGPFPAPGTLLRVVFHLSTAGNAATCEIAMALSPLPDESQASILAGVRLGRGLIPSILTVPSVSVILPANWETSINRQPNAKIRDPFLYLLVAVASNSLVTGITGWVEATSSELTDPHPLTVIPAKLAVVTQASP